MPPYHARASVAGHAALVAAVSAMVAAGCLDLRDYRGRWAGPRIGDTPPLRTGLEDAAEASLEIDEASMRALKASLAVPDSPLANSTIAPLPGAEADALADMTFAGAPARVYLSFAPTSDGAGDALAIVALYGDPRIELRILRGDPVPLYGIFALSRVE